jgi:sodium/potassium-transporting ATPase subunit alpha
MVNVFLCRHPRAAAWSLPWRSNPLLLWGLALEAGLLLVLVYTPPGQQLFATHPFPAAAWLAMLLGALAIGLLEEGRKAWLRRH